MNVRWDGPETRAFCRTAPRVVMFGITNRCNMGCSFCSRDLHAQSHWTTASAYEMLAGLARAGVLEVAFGGGEPLVFRGFDELIARLGQETELALHVTTNGTLLTRERLARLAPFIGEIRVSIYDDNPWPERVEMLASEDVRFGANVLVTPSRILALPALLHRLATLGCRDVALLSYVGPDPHMTLSLTDEARLAAVVAESPIRARLSVCFGDRLDPIPRLFDGDRGDCGAGLDFLVLTSDGKMKSCSFQNEGIEVATSEDVLRVWREKRNFLLRPAERLGCARPALRTPVLSDGVRIWQSYSGNNSGDCVLVGRFETVKEARGFVDLLAPGFVPSEPFSDAWKALLESEGISLGADELSPDELFTLGRTVMVHTNSALDDDFPSLRTLLWKRGGRSVYAGIHEHDPVVMLAGVGFRDERSLDDGAALARASKLGEFERRGRDLFGFVRLYGPGPVPPTARASELAEFAEAHGAVASAELTSLHEEADFPSTLAARPPARGVERLWARFRTEEEAVAFAGLLGGKFNHAGRYVIVEAEKIGSRVGYLAQRHGGIAEVIGGETMRLVPTFWGREKGKNKRRDDEPLDPGEIAKLLLPKMRPYLRGSDTIELAAQWRSVTGIVDTPRPLEALSALVDFARTSDLDIWIEGHPTDRLVHSLGRVASDLTELRRVRNER